MVPRVVLGAEVHGGVRRQIQAGAPAQGEEVRVAGDAHGSRGPVVALDPDAVRIDLEDPAAGVDGDRPGPSRGLDLPRGDRFGALPAQGQPAAPLAGCGAVDADFDRLVVGDGAVEHVPAHGHRGEVESLFVPGAEDGLDPEVLPGRRPQPFGGCGSGVPPGAGAEQVVEVAVAAAVEVVGRGRQHGVAADEVLELVEEDPARPEGAVEAADVGADRVDHPGVVEDLIGEREDRRLQQRVDGGEEPHPLKQRLQVLVVPPPRREVAGDELPGDAVQRRGRMAGVLARVDLIEDRVGEQPAGEVEVVVAPEERVRFEEPVRHEQHAVPDLDEVAPQRGFDEHHPAV